jgi:hypothetical protein
MVKRIIVGILILALIFSNVSCSGIVHTTHKISAKELRGKVDKGSRLNEASRKMDNNIIEVSSSKGITGVMLNTWEIVSFDSLGAIFDFESNTLTATDVNGRERIINIDEIREIFYSAEGSKITFNSDRGKIDIDKQMITGIADYGQAAEIPVDDVLYMKVKNLNIPLTILLIGGTVALSVLFIKTLDNTEWVSGISDSDQL